jgi:prepilin-type N-terminal cleavage/methylation domain-containing protein
MTPKNTFKRKLIERETSRPAGFTLMELVIVIVIILLISALLLPSVLGGLTDRKFSDAARTMQAVFVGARDRAIQSGNIVGVRLIRDDTDPFNAIQLMFVTVPEPFSLGRVTVSGTTVTPVGAPQPDPHFEQVDPGKNGVTTFPPTYDFDDIPRVVPGLSTSRFDFAGRLYRIMAVNPGTPATLTISPAASLGTGSHQYQIFGAPVPKAQADAIAMPDGIVIDLRGAGDVIWTYPSPYTINQSVYVPRSRGIPNAAPPIYPGLDNSYGTPDDIHWLGTDQSLGTADDALPTTWPPMDILFAPNGQVTGAAAAKPLVHFWIGERGDKGTDPVTSRGSDNSARTDDDLLPNRRRLLVSLNTRTGAMQVIHEPGTASIDNWPPASTTDDYADIYAPAEKMLGVSLLP